jgi:hypothetical protein
MGGCGPAQNSTAPRRRVSIPPIFATLMTGNQNMIQTPVPTLNYWLCDSQPRLQLPRPHSFCPAGGSHNGEYEFPSHNGEYEFPKGISLLGSLKCALVERKTAGSLISSCPQEAFTLTTRLMSAMALLRQVMPSFSRPRATGVAVLARFPPKVHDGRTPQHRICCGISRLRVEAEGHLNAPTGLSEHPSPLSDFLNLSQPI